MTLKEKERKYFDIMIADRDTEFCLYHGYHLVGRYDTFLDVEKATDELVKRLRASITNVDHYLSYVVGGQ